jgi:hypothetical protein
VEIEPHAIFFGDRDQQDGQPFAGPCVTNTRIIAKEWNDVIILSPGAAALPLTMQQPMMAA